MEWQCKYFPSVHISFFRYDIGAYSILSEGDKTYLLIGMPAIHYLSSPPVYLELHLLDSGSSYNEKVENGELGHWAWNKNKEKITLDGSIGEQGFTIHCTLIDGVLKQI